MWHYQDPYHNPYPYHQMPPRGYMDEDPIKAAKTAIRFYKSILAEEGRKVKSKEDEAKKNKKPSWFDKVSKGQVAAILFFTWPVVALSQIYMAKLVFSALGSILK